MAIPGSHLFRSCLSPPFLLCGLLLLLCPLVRAAMEGLQEHYSKHRIPIRRSLHAFKPQLPSFKALKVQSAPPSSEALDTEEWSSLWFLPRQSQEKVPVYSLITYYSDPHYQIAHTPEVCYRQGGAKINSNTTIKISTPVLAPENPQIEGRLLHMERHSGVHQVLVYVFYSNGKFYNDREHLRLAIGMPGDKYVYYSKVEAATMVSPDSDPQVAIERCKQMLREVLPILLEDHFPTKDDVRGSS